MRFKIKGVTTVVFKYSNDPCHIWEYDTQPHLSFSSVPGTRLVVADTQIKMTEPLLQDAPQNELTSAGGPAFTGLSSHQEVHPR